MSEIKLLPCPFCGGEASVLSDCSYSRTDGETMYYVRCQYCASESSWEYSEEEAIKRWNTRKPMQEIVERLEEVGKEEIKIHRARCNGKTLAFGFMLGIQQAINLVKEVGGMSD